MFTTTSQEVGDLNDTSKTEYRRAREFNVQASISVSQSERRRNPRYICSKSKILEQL